MLAPFLYARTPRDWPLRLPLAANLRGNCHDRVAAGGCHLDLDCRCPIPGGNDSPLYGNWSLPARDLPKPIPAALLGMVVFGTNLFHGGPTFEWGLRSTIASYVKELARPPGDPFATAAQWINANVPPGCSVYVRPAYMVYPLMFHAPGAIYAWQFRAPPAPQFKGLPPIHFFHGRNCLISSSPSVLSPRSLRPTSSHLATDGSATNTPLCSIRIGTTCSAPSCSGTHSDRSPSKTRRPRRSMSFVVSRRRSTQMPTIVIVTVLKPILWRSSDRGKGLRAGGRRWHRPARCARPRRCCAAFARGPCSAPAAT